MNAIRLSVCVLLASVMMGGPVRALEWDVDALTPGAQGGAGSWNSANSNWWDGTGNSSWIPASGAVFGGPAGAVTLLEDVAADDLEFLADGYLLQGGTITLGSAGILCAGTTTVNSAFSIPADVPLAVSAGKTLTLNGAIGGIGGLWKQNPGTLVLAGTGTYGGGVHVTDGLVQLAANGAVLPSNTSVEVSSGATFDFAGFSPGVNNQAYRFSLAGTGTEGQGAVINSGGAVYGNASIATADLAGHAAVGGIGRFDFGTSATGAGEYADGHGFVLTKVGPNEVNLRCETLTNFAAIVVSNGTIKYETFSRNDADSAATTNYVMPGARIASYGNVTLNYPVVMKSGTVSVFDGGGGNPNWTGAFLVESNITVDAAQGELTISGVISGDAVLYKTGGNNFRPMAENLFTGGIVASGGVVQFDTDLNLGPVPASPSTNIVLNGAGLKNDDSSPVLEINRTILLGTGNGYITCGWAGNGHTFTVHGKITGPGGLGINQDGSWIILDNPANDYAGNTTVHAQGPGASYGGGSSGKLRLGAAEVIPHGAGKGSFTVNGGGTFDLNGFSETVNGLNGGGVVDNEGSGMPVTFTFGDGNQGGNFSGVIQNTAGALAVRKIGTGEQQWTGASTNTFSGGLSVDGGSLWFTEDTKLGAVPVAPEISVSLNGGGLKNQDSAPTTDVNRTISLGADGGYLTAGWSKSLALGGQVTGTGGLFVCTDSGNNWLLSPLNDYAGNTTVGVRGPGFWDGTRYAGLVLGADEVIPHGAGKGGLVVNQGGVVDINGKSETVNFIAGGGIIENRAAGTTNTLSVGAADGAGAYYGLIRPNGGAIRLAKYGSGTQFIGGGTYAGGTDVNEGTLALGATAGSDAVNLNGGTLELAGGAGLLCGVLRNQGSLDLNTANPGNVGVHLSTLMFNITSGWGDNSTYIYTGRMFVPTNATWTFAENIDDEVALRIDGALLLFDVSWNTPTKTNVFLAAGWHDIDIRARNGGGGAGYVNSSWMNLHLGFVFDPQGRDSQNGADYQPLVDPGDGSFLRMPGDPMVANEVTAASQSPIRVADGQRGVLTGRLTGGSSLSKTGAGTLVLDATLALAGTLSLDEGRLQMPGDTGAGSLTLNGGTLLLDTIPGLRAGVLYGGVGIAPNTPNPGNLGLDRTTSFMNRGGWGDNTTYIYTGAFFVPGPTNTPWTFVEAIDDNFWLRIDGQTVLENYGWDQTAKNTIPLAPGWHNFEARGYNGTGGAGPSGSPGWLTNGLGFAYDPLGRDSTNAVDYQILQDPGNGTVLRSRSAPAVANRLIAAAPSAIEVPTGVVGFLNGTVEGSAAIDKTGEGTLVLNTAGNTHDGALTIRSGTVRMAAGLGAGQVVLQGGALNFEALPGLKAGSIAINGGIDTTTPNSGDLGVDLTTTYMNQGGWGNDIEYIYSGAFYVPQAGAWTFAENVDDRFWLSVDGSPVLDNADWSIPTKANIFLSEGWHTIEVRGQNDGGGAGPSNQGWLTGNKGFVVDKQGRDSEDPNNYEILADSGDGLTFRSQASYTLDNDITLQSNAPVNVAAAHDVVLNGMIGGPAGFTKTGDGSLALAGAGTFLGPATVSGGVLRVNGSLSGPGLLSVAPGGTLGGNGTMAGPLWIAGTLEPGASVGTLTVSNDVTIAPGGTFAVEVEAAFADLLQLDGVAGHDVVLDGGARLSLTGAPVITAVYPIVQGAGSVAGIFATPAGAPLPTGTELNAFPGWSGWYIHYRTTSIVIDEAPSGLAIDTFAATVTNGQRQVRWHTTSETGAAGFWLERWDGSRYVRLNGVRISAIGAGSTYSFNDPTAVAGRRYTYRIVGDYSGGSNEVYGPFERIMMQDLILTSPFGKGVAGIDLTWQSREGEVYRIMSTTNLLSGNWMTNTTGRAATPPVNAWTDPAPAAPSLMYRIEVE